jgi:Flp pilus assembly protein TadB
MKQDETKRKKMKTFFVMGPLLLACFFLFVAWIWAYRGDWARFVLFGILTIVVAMWFPTLILCRKIDERFERLEKILSNKNQGGKELKIVEQELRDSPKKK